MHNRDKIINLITSTATTHWQVLAFKYVKRVVVFRRYNETHLELLDDKGSKLIKISATSRLRWILRWIQHKQIFEHFSVNDTTPVTKKVCVLVWKLNPTYIENVTSKYIDEITVDGPVDMEKYRVDPFKQVLATHMYDVLSPVETYEKVINECK